VQALLVHQSQQDQQHMQQQLAGLGSALATRLQALGLGVGQQLQEINIHLVDIKEQINLLSSNGQAELQGSAGGGNDSRPRHPSSSKGQGPSGERSGTPLQLWRLAVADMIRQADADLNNEISPLELSHFLFSYGLRVGDDLARKLVHRYHRFATPGDVGSLQLFLQECWDAMLAALPEGFVAEEGRELVLSKQQCAQALPEFAGNRKVQQVMASVRNEEEISYSLFVSLVLRALHA
jgi:hypothetical protein